MDAQSCPSGCTLIPSGPVDFCRCHLFTTTNSSDRVQLVTDRTYSMFDINGDLLTDIPFGIYARGNTGTYVLQKISPGIPGSYNAVKISDTVAYGMTPAGDRNADGIEDFAVACHDMYGGVYLLLSPGTFPSTYSPLELYPPLRSTPNSIISAGNYVWWSDYRGFVHMYDMTTNTHIVSVDSLCGDGVAVGDFNLDGYIDVACTNYRSTNQGIYIHYFNGSSFLPAYVLDNSRPWQGITSYDIDGNGYRDLIAVGTEVSVWLNFGTYWTEVSVDPDLARRPGSYPPFSRVALAGIDCDSDIDIVVSTSCPNSGEPLLVWYENLGGATSWAKHPIETSGNSCFVGGYPYPYGLRVGFLDEGPGIDIVIVRGASNQFWGYFTDTCGTLAYDSGLVVTEKPTTPRLEDISVVSGGIILRAQSSLSARIYDASGRHISSVNLQAGKSTFVPLNKGVYFVSIRRNLYKLVINR